MFNFSSRLPLKGWGRYSTCLCLWETASERNNVFNFHILIFILITFQIGNPCCWRRKTHKVQSWRRVREKKYFFIQARNYYLPNQNTLRKWAGGFRICDGKKGCAWRLHCRFELFEFQFKIRHTVPIYLTMKVILNTEI